MTSVVGVPNGKAPPRGGGLRLPRLRLLRFRLWSHGEKDGEQRWRGSDEKELLKDGDPRCRGGLRERARMGLRERERCGGSPTRDERSLEGVLPRRGETRRRAISRTLKDVRCVLWIESEGRIAHASMAAPAIVSQSTVVSNSASTAVRPLRALKLANFVKSLPVITLC